MSITARWFLRLVVAGVLAVAGTFLAAGTASASHGDAVAGRAARVTTSSLRANRAGTVQSSSVGSQLRTRAVQSTGTVRATSHRSFGSGPISADIVHRGDNEVDIDQDADARSGDCVAGSQVIGIVGRGSVRASNWSDGADCRSGDARASNRIGSVHAGPRVIRTGPTTGSADLAVTKTATGAINGDRTFRVVVTNNGPSAAQNVVLTDIVVEGTATVTPDPGTGFTCGGTGTPVTCTAPSMAAGETAGFTVVTNVTILSNTARVSSATPDPNLANNEDVVVIPGGA